MCIKWIKQEEVNYLHLELVYWEVDGYNRTEGGTELQLVLQRKLLLDVQTYL